MICTMNRHTQHIHIVINPNFSKNYHSTSF